MGMMTRERFYRPPEVFREPYRLPAVVYNIGRLLVVRTDSGRLYVPIASMRYLAVLDDNEWLFVERAGRHTIEAAWQEFQPRERTGLHDPVACQKVLYVNKSPRFMQRLQDEFFNVIQAIVQKSRAGREADVVRLVHYQSL